MIKLEFFLDTLYLNWSLTYLQTSEQPNGQTDYDEQLVSEILILSIKLR